MSTKTISTDLSKHIEGDDLPTLPLIHPLRLAYLFSLLIVVITAVVAITGLLYPNDIYPTEELRQSFLANDAVTLLIGLPILLGSMWLAWRGKRIGLLFWPGALLYGLYNYVVYLFGMPLNVMFPFYLMIVTFSIYTTIALVVCIDGEVVKKQLNGRVPEKFGGGVLIGFGVLFMLRSLGVMTDALINQLPIARPELALLVADFSINAAWLIGGILLWRRQALGYVGGTGLLFQASMLFIGLIAFLILKPILTEAPFLLTDTLAIFVMGFVCFIPSVLFIHAMIEPRRIK